jgi:hypothetical protein
VRAANPATSSRSDGAVVRPLTDDSARSICSSPSDNWFANSVPASVRITRPPARANSGWPMNSSSERICWLIALCVSAS